MNGSTAILAKKLLANFSHGLRQAPRAIGWTPDGHALTSLLTEGSAQNLNMQPLSGGKPVRLMHFDDEPSFIAAYSWSRDGKKIAITRSRFNDTDVVMFSGFH
jgi:hypothetical protein